MQNFTLGKKGLSMLFFAFILLIGSSPTFGQCPVPQDDDATTAGNQQEFCALSTVSMLQVSDFDGVAPSELRWYDSETPSANEDAIPSNEILENGKVYYAGNSDKSCASREGVTAEVTDVGPPVLAPGEDEFFTPCQRVAGNPDNNDIGTLKGGIEFNEVAGFKIEYYADEFDKNSPILPDDTELISGTSYFAGLVGIVPSTCQTSSRTAIRYEPVVVPAPAAEPVQTVCPGTTVGELEAEGTNRWYRTATSEPPLPNGTVLEDGKVYFATQIIPSDGPPCESKERTRVGVIVQQPVDLGTPAEGIICESDVSETFPSIDAIRNFYLGLLPEGTPTNGTFDPTPAELADMYQADEDGLGDFTTTYTVGVDGCESSVELTATIVEEEEANAGTIEDILVECGNEDIIILDDSILSEDATTGGTFSGEGLNEDGNFDPAVGPGTYTITYSVDDNADCVIEGTTDSTTFNITVQGSELGEPIILEMCIIEVQELIETPADAEAFFNNILAENGITNFDGSFDPSEDIVGTAIFAYINSNPTAPETFNTTYTVTSECGEDSVEITLTINNTEEPNAGEINPAPVCSSATPFDLNSLLGDNNNPGGTFSNEDGVIEDGLFDVSEAGTYDITYTVTESDENCTAGEDDSTEFTLTVREGVVAESPEAAIVCETDVDALFPSIDEIRKFYIAIAQRAGFPTDGTLNPTASQLAQMYQNDEDGLGDFTTTYTFGDGDCQTSVDLTVTIIPAEEANAGSIENVTVECDSDELIVLASLPNEGGNTGGTFSGEGVNEEGNFDPSVGPGTYTITYSVDDNADCVIEGTSDSTTFNITVQGSELGEPIVMEMCIIEVQELIESPADAEAFFNNILAENGITNFDGSFDPSEDIVGTAIFAYINSNPTAPETFNTTYTVTSECGEDSVEITLTINNTEEPNAGEINPAPVCSSATLFDLKSLLGDNNNPGGTFSNEDGELIEEGLFDVSQVGEFSITYTVTESDENCTAGDPDATEFTLTVNEGTVAESPEAAIVCETDVDVLFPSIDEIRKFYVAIAQRAGFPTDGTLNPTASQLAQMFQNDEDGLGDFTTTYTFGGDDCQTSVELTATIIPVEEANAGSIENVTVECDSEEPIVLASLPNEGGNTGGTFTGEGVENGNFNPSIGAGTYTITYSVDDTADCVTPGTSAETTFTITVQDSFDLGATIVMEMCITEVEALLTNPQLAIDLFNDAVAERTDGDLSGEFSPSIQTIAGQIAAFLSDPSASQTFETTYSVSTSVSTDCGEDSVLISLTINNTVAPSAGEINPAPVCASATPFDLNSLLGDNNNQGGTFSNEDGVIEDGLFDVSEAGTYDITYTVTESDENCTAGEDDSTEFTLTVDEGTVAESPDAAIVCETDVQALFPSVDEIRKFYIAIAQRAGFPTNGTLNPTASQLATIYQNDEDMLGDFTTTYTFGDGDCQTSVDLTVTIIPTEEATVEPIEDDSVCVSEEGLDLSTYVSNNTMGGTFTSSNGTITGNTLDVSIEGTFNITYTVDESDPSTCLTGNASEDFAITVGGNANAGADNSIEVCNVDVRDLRNAGVRNLFLDLLESGISRDGTFNPTIQEIIDQYQTVSNFGDFTTEYTVEEGECTDSAMLTVTVIEANDAGDDRELDFCSTEDPVNLFDFLSPFATTTGTFVGFEDGMFDPATANTGVTTIEYQVEEDESICSTGNFTSTFEITVTEPEAANAGEDTPAEFCVEQNEDIQLSTLLTDGANPRGSFEAPFENGIFNPSVVGEGVYEIDYTVDEDDCATGTATVTLTITVTATGETPVADAEQTFCLVDDPTVADIVVDGENIVIYEDAELTIVADDTDPLVNGAEYYALSDTEGNACGSDAVMITVTLIDADAPTLVIEGNEFCRIDNPTVQELINNLNGSGIQIYSSSTGGTALATTTALQDGVTYFASGTNSTTQCESSERLAVQVEVGFCGIPEGFSPNDDGKNDEFVIPDIAIDFPNYTIQVYNRWGSLVFEGNASTGDWDGLSNQSATLGDGVLPSGVYFYILDYNDGQTQPVQGKVYLSR